MTAESRRLGHVAATLVEMVKLYESERRYVGADALSMSRRRPADEHLMFDGLTRFSLKRDLIDNMEKRLLSAVAEAEAAPDDDGCAAVAREIWARLSGEETAIGRFRRLQGPA
ncbi:MAG: hypothetical protein AAF322_09895, partial [Pseudomonadota bacterium]